MTATNHALSGAAVALIVQEPIIALPLAFMSHFLVDAIPHFSFPDNQIFKRSFNTLLISDAALCIVLTILFWFLFPGQGLLIGVCMFVATSPDLMWAYYRLYLAKLRGIRPQFGQLAQFHHKIQGSSHARFAKRGMVVESVWFASFLGSIVAVSL